MRFGVSQTSWNPLADFSSARKFSEFGLSSVTLVPSKYDQDFEFTTLDWSHVRDFWSGFGFEISCIQGFLFGSSHSIDVASDFFENTRQRFSKALECAIALECPNLILGAPSSRESNHLKGIGEGIEILNSMALGQGRSLLIENLPHKFTGYALAKASDLVSFADKAPGLQICLDIGNLFSWHTSYETALFEIQQALDSNAVQHLQFNVLEPIHLLWLIDLLKERTLASQFERALLTIEAQPVDFETSIKVLKKLTNP